MNTDDPAADDEGLLAALREVLSHDEPPPGWATELAKSSFGFRTADAELAVLVSDSAGASAASTVRSSQASRLAVFGTSDLSVEIEIEPGARADTWRLIGQLTPAGPARIQARRRQADPVPAVADDLGRFVVDRLSSGPLSLVCAREGRPDAVTEWIAIGLRRHPRGRY